MSDMTISRRCAEETCDLIDFLVNLPCPMSGAAFKSVAIDRYGWSLEQEAGVDYLVDSVTKLTRPDVTVIHVAGYVTSIHFYVADALPRSPDTTIPAVVGDLSAATVREGTSRWGRSSLSSSPDVQKATWKTQGDASCKIRLEHRWIAVEFQAPQGVSVDREINPS